jgi:peptidyl-tRNA hydrolase
LLSFMGCNVGDAVRDIGQQDGKRRIRRFRIGVSHRSRLQTGIFGGKMQVVVLGDFSPEELLRLPRRVVTDGIVINAMGRSQK